VLIPYLIIKNYSKILEKLVFGVLSLEIGLQVIPRGQIFMSIAWTTTVLGLVLNRGLGLDILALGALCIAC